MTIPLLPPNEAHEIIARLETSARGPLRAAQGAEVDLFLAGKAVLFLMAAILGLLTILSGLFSDFSFLTMLLSAASLLFLTIGMVIAYSANRLQRQTPFSPFLPLEAGRQLLKAGVDLPIIPLPSDCPPIALVQTDSGYAWALGGSGHARLVAVSALEAETRSARDLLHCPKRSLRPLARLLFLEGATVAFDDLSPNVRAIRLASNPLFERKKKTS